MNPDLKLYCPKHGWISNVMETPYGAVQQVIEQHEETCSKLVHLRPVDAEPEPKKKKRFGR